MKSITVKTVALGVSISAASAFGAPPQSAATEPASGSTSARTTGTQTGQPFEQTQFDRTLPNVPQRTAAEPASSGASIQLGGLGWLTAFGQTHNFIAAAK
jgi:hypothetical protein